MVSQGNSIRHLEKGFPGGSAGKESTCNAGDMDSIPGSKRSRGEGQDNPLHYIITVENISFSTATNINSIYFLINIILDIRCPFLDVILDNVVFIGFVNLV